MYRNIALLLTVLMCAGSAVANQPDQELQQDNVNRLIGGGWLFCLASGYFDMSQLDALAIAKKSRDTKTTEQVDTLRWGLSLGASIGLGCLTCMACDSLCSSASKVRFVAPSVVVGSSFYAANESLKTLHNKAANVGAGYNAERWLNSYEIKDQKPYNDTNQPS